MYLFSIKKLLAIKVINEKGGIENKNLIIALDFRSIHCIVKNKMPLNFPVVFVVVKSLEKIYRVFHNM